MRSPTRIVDVENNSLPLAQHAEDRALERVGGQVELGERGVADDAAVARRRVVALDDALHSVAASAGLDDLAALDATRADVHPLRGTADEGLHTLDVRVPTTLGAPVGVRHVHTPAGALATHFTHCCHDGSSSTRSNELEDATSGRPHRHARSAPSLSSVPTLARVTPGAMRRTVITFRDTMEMHADGINRLNVYPVPDGDTGTNMARTLDAVVAELDLADLELEPTCNAISHGSLMGARGNSGVILSQILRGLVGTLKGATDLTATKVAEGLKAASAAAYQA